MTAAAETGSVLVLDGEARSALAITRSLGRHGCRVIVGAPGAASIAGSSRFAAATFRYPDPANDPDGFVAAIVDAASRFAAEAVIPPTDATIAPLVVHARRFPESVRLMTAPLEVLQQAHDKIALVELAQRLGVSVPRGVAIDSQQKLDSELPSLLFPLILKPRLSRWLHSGRVESFGVQRIDRAEALRERLAEDRQLLDLGFLLQEIVPGEGRGVFVLADRGVIRGAFAHRRLREKPPWGGVSTLCESTMPEPELLDWTERLIAALGFSGLAMVEFKWDPGTRRGWLIEINGRPWGSLQLAIASGADLPWGWYCQAVRGSRSDAVSGLPGTRLWWLLGDLDHFLIRLKQQGIAGAGRCLIDLMRTRQGHRLALETFQLSDPLPFLRESMEWVKALAR